MTTSTAVGGLVEALHGTGLDFVASVPDSRIAPLIEALSSDERFTQIDLTREDEGVGVCAGAYFGGRIGCLLIQNSGLLESINDLVTLAIFSQVPMVLLVVYRGHLGEPHWYHGPVGRVTDGVLRTLGIKYAVIDDPQSAQATLAGARLLAESSVYPVTVLVTLGALEECAE